MPRERHRIRNDLKELKITLILGTETDFNNQKIIATAATANLGEGRESDLKSYHIY